MDETPVRVQAPGKGKCDTGYFWVMLRDERNWNPEAQPAVVFEYAPSRAGSVAADLLSGTSIEYLQTDSYGGYNRLFAEGNANNGIRSVKCWAHARRKFKESVDTQKSPLAKRIISLLKKVYGVERQIKGLTPIERAGKRHEYSLPILQSIKAELMQYKDDAQGKVKTAIEYRGAYSTLTEYLRLIRPAVPRQFERRFETFAGQQAQVDFVEFQVEFTSEPGLVRKVWLFSMVAVPTTLC